MSITVTMKNNAFARQMDENKGEAANLLRLARGPGQRTARDETSNQRMADADFS